MLGNALRLVREFHNIKQRDLAAKLDVSASFLSELEGEKKQVTLELLKKYSDFFSIPMSSLLYFAEAKDTLFSKKNENPIAAKALMMLEWISMITKGEHDEGPDQQVAVLPTRK